MRVPSLECLVSLCPSGELRFFKAQQPPYPGVGLVLSQCSLRPLYIAHVIVHTGSSLLARLSPLLVNEVLEDVRGDTQYVADIHWSIDVQKD